VSEKLYALYSLDERGEPVIHKYSSHVLGQYRSPLPGDSHAWIIEAWEREIRAALGAPIEPFPWDRAAITRAPPARSLATRQRGANRTGAACDAGSRGTSTLARGWRRTRP
jgi:hypothetical protein